MKGWGAIIVAGAALLLSGSQWFSGDRLKVEQRVTALEGQATANQAALKEIQNDVREIRQYLLGEKKR